MTRYILVSVISGFLFGFLDGLLNANPLAIRLFQVYQPILRSSINIVMGMIIDLAYGFVLSALFLLLYPVLPGKTGLVKGISFAVMVWFLRVVMSAASQWMMFAVPLETLAYTLLAGLGEMLVLGVLYGFALRPAKRAQPN